MGYRIGSLNMYKYQAHRSDDEIRKDLDKIAEIIIKEEFDVIALQEIFSEKAMNNLLRRLGINWKGCWACPNSRSVQAAEGYAFLWNQHRIKLAESITSSGRRIYYPRIYNQYRINRGENQRELIRNPYYARFTPLHGFFEIRLINIHIMYSENKKGSEDSVSLSDAALRRKEFEILAKSIYAKEADKRYGNNMPAYTFILGDYNLNLNREWTKSPYVDEVVGITDMRSVKMIRTVQDQLTTLKQPSSDEEDDGYANNYDHFSYDEIRFAGIDVHSQRVDTVFKYFNNDFGQHRKEMSDHVPIYLDLE